ncbi:MAG: hypothetical protein HYR97_01295, partial [Candidatus Melainabacteria bacterium]|nr:hypothetical protein [Candidatus Melainabacteria bacterium]
ECNALSYASESGSPEERRCFLDCVNNTTLAQVNCGVVAPPPAAPAAPAPDACTVYGGSWDPLTGTCVSATLPPAPPVDYDVASCPYWPSVRACNADGTLVSQDEIKNECNTLSYANESGNSQEQQCFLDCVNNTTQAQANCGAVVPPPAAGVDASPAVAPDAPLDPIAPDPVAYPETYDYIAPDPVAYPETYDYITPDPVVYPETYNYIAPDPVVYPETYDYIAPDPVAEPYYYGP